MLYVGLAIFIGRALWALYERWSDRAYYRRNGFDVQEQPMPAQEPALPPRPVIADQHLRGGR